jgi:hypothetical protein
MFKGAHRAHLPSGKLTPWPVCYWWWEDGDNNVLRARKWPGHILGTDNPKLG